MGRTPIEVKDITAPVSTELGQLERELAAIFSSEISLIAAIGEHLVSVRGKRLRPALVLLTARLGKPDIAKAIRVAAAVEIIHTATLLHDDSIDRSHLRRGSPTVNKVWNDQVSVIMGDYLFCKAFKLVHEAGLSEIAAVLAEGSDSLTFGEIYQMDLRGRYDISEETYLEMITHKTASLFSCACEAGAMLGGLDDDKRSRLKAYGVCLGTAFQIIDDVLDFVGDVDVMGKPVGNDLRDGRLTLPVLAALRNASETEAADVRSIMPPHVLGEREWKRVVTFIEDHGGIEYAYSEARRLVKQAKMLIAELPPRPPKDSLLLLADLVVSRRK
jgi:octaprenyl-diphosphate synthase